MSGNSPQESKAISNDNNPTQRRNPKGKALSLISFVLKAWSGQGSAEAPIQRGGEEALEEGLSSRTGVVAEATVKVFLGARPVYMICRLDFI